MKQTSDKEKVNEILERLKRKYPTPEIALRHSNPLEILVATILSAQCTDKRVNLVTKNLFSKYKTAGDYANADPDEFRQEIRSMGFYKNKARNIINCCRILVEKFDSGVPKTMQELITL